MDSTLLRYDQSTHLWCPSRFYPRYDSYITASTTVEIGYAPETANFHGCSCTANEYWNPFLHACSGCPSAPAEVMPYCNQSANPATATIQAQLSIQGSVWPLRATAVHSATIAGGQLHVYRDFLFHDSLQDPVTLALCPSAVSCNHDPEALSRTGLYSCAPGSDVDSLLVLYYLRIHAVLRFSVEAFVNS